MPALCGVPCLARPQGRDQETLSPRSREPSRKQTAASCPWPARCFGESSKPAACPRPVPEFHLQNASFPVSYRGPDSSNRDCYSWYYLYLFQRTSMTFTAEQRSQLADFLRTRRALLSPPRVGLPAGKRRKVPGLRREEVAELAGIGATWYTWLEQGREVNVSARTLQQLADALLLAPDTRTYLFPLARPQPPPLNPTTHPPP